MPDLYPRHFLPEQGDYLTLKRAVLNALVGDVPEAIKRCLFNAGFAGVRVLKIVNHAVYELSMRRGPAMAEQTEVQVRNRIRHALRGEGLYKTSKTTFLVISVHGQRIVCGFNAAEHNATEPVGPDVERIV